MIAVDHSLMAWEKGGANNQKGGGFFSVRRREGGNLASDLMGLPINREGTQD